MRFTIAMAVGLLALPGLAACSGEEAFRNTMRASALANCQRGASPEALATAREMGTSAEELCTCGIDRYMRTVSYEQLKQDRNNPEPPMMRNAMMQCMAEHMQRAGRTAASPVPESAAPGRIREDANRLLEDARSQADRAVEGASSEPENVQAELERATR